MKTFRIPLIFLIFSIIVSLLTILSFYVGDYRFYPDNHTFQLLTYAGLAAAVLEGAWMMYFSRGEIARIRKIDNEFDRLASYRKAYSRQYVIAFLAECVVCACIVLSYNRAIIMVLLVLTMVMVVLFPNMYKAKNDLSLSDETMKSVFGDKYIQ